MAGGSSDPLDKPRVESRIALEIDVMIDYSIAVRLKRRARLGSIELAVRETSHVDFVPPIFRTAATAP